MKKLLIIIVPIIACLVFLFTYEKVEQYNDLKANLLNEVVIVIEEVEEIKKTIINYTDDQIDVIEEFGKPDEFIINFESDDEPRYEVWTYIGLGEIFVFEDGNFVEGTTYDFGIDDESYVRARISPKDIYGINSLEELNEKVGIEPTIKGEIDEEFLENTEYYEYGDVISVATTNNKISFIKTQTFSIQD